MSDRGKVVLVLAGLVGVFWMLAYGVLVWLYEAPKWLMVLVFGVAFVIAMVSMTICSCGAVEAKDEV